VRACARARAWMSHFNFLRQISRKIWKIQKNVQIKVAWFRKGHILIIVFLLDGGAKKIEGYSIFLNKIV